MRPKIKQWVTLSIGWAFLVLGVLGLFLPVLQGILFLFIGLIILSSEYVWAHRLLTKVRNRFPSVAQHAAAEKVRGWLRRIRGGPKETFPTTVNDDSGGQMARSTDGQST